MASLPKSLPRICVALGFPDPESLTRAAELEIKDGGTFLELRLDYLWSPEAGLSVLRHLRKQHPELYFWRPAGIKKITVVSKGRLTPRSPCWLVPPKWGPSYSISNRKRGPAREHLDQLRHKLRWWFRDITTSKVRRRLIPSGGVCAAWTPMFTRLPLRRGSPATAFASPIFFGLSARCLLLRSR